MNQEIDGQPSILEIKSRELAEQYIQIEENTQLLSQVYRFNPKVRLTPLRLQTRINPLSFLRLIVQIAYLLYTCYLNKLNVFLSSQIFTKPSKRGQSVSQQDAFRVYLLQFDFQQMTSQQQKIILSQFRLIDFTRSQSSYGQFLADFILRIRSILKPHLQKNKNSQEAIVIDRQLQCLTQIIQKYIMPQMQSIIPKTIILSLQQSELFRENCFLVKCFNNSFFSHLKLHPQRQQIYRKLYQLQKTKNNIVRLQNCLDKSIQQMLQMFIRCLFDKKIVSIDRSLNSQYKIKDRQPCQDTFNLFFGSIEGSSQQNQKYIAKIYLNQKPFKTFSKNILKQISSKTCLGQFSYFFPDNKDNSGPKNEYIIEYMPSRLILTLKYVIDIDVNLENTDFLTFHTNYLSYNLNNINFQFVQKIVSASKTVKKKQRFLALKAAACVHPNEPILFKILVMLDTLMVHGKLTALIFQKNINNMTDYTEKFKQLNDHCEHLKRIFLSKIDSYYQQIRQNLQKQ